jgi:Iap family predicted aminopeptidase
MSRMQALARIAAAELTPDFDALTQTGGRLVGSKSEAAARSRLQQRLKNIPDVRLGAHQFEYASWASTGSSLELIGRGGAKALPCHPLYWAAATPPAGLETALVDVGRGSEADFASLAHAVSGKAVLVRHEYQFSQETIHRRLKYRYSQAHGAAGFIIANHNPGGLLVTGACGEDSPNNIPAAGVSFETGAMLAAVDQPRIRLRIASVRQPSMGLNLVAEAAGRTPEWVVLCAHYDGHDLAQSALDNATGVVAAITVFERLRPFVRELRRGLRLILFTAEETGLTGSRLYLQSLEEAERRNIALAINLDTIAGSPRLTCLISGFDELEKFVSQTAMADGMSLHCYRPLLRNSDHFNFAQNGIPAMRLVAGFDEPQSGARFLLTEADTRDRVSMDELRRAAITAATLVWSALEWPDRIAAHRPPAAIT